MPGAFRERFAGRITRSELREIGADLHAPPDVVAQRQHVGAGGEKLVGDLGRQPRSVGRVLAVHDAEVDREILLEAGQALLDRMPPRRPEDVGEKEDSQGIDSVCRGVHGDRHAVPRVGGEAGERLLLDLGQVRDSADSRRGCGERVADLECRVGAQLRDRHDRGRVGERLDVDLRAHLAPVDHVRREADDVPVDRGVDVRPGGGAYVERGVPGAGPAQGVVTRPVASSSAEDAVERARDEALVPLRAERSKLERGVARPVHADGRQPLLWHRELDAHRALECDHLWARRTRRKEPLCGRGRGSLDRALVRRGESRQEKGHEQDGAQDDREGDTPGPPARLKTALSLETRLSGRTRAHRSDRSGSGLLFQQCDRCGSL